MRPVEKMKNLIHTYEISTIDNKSNYYILVRYLYGIPNTRRVRDVISIDDKTPRYFHGILSFDSVLVQIISQEHIL